MSVVRPFPIPSAGFLRNAAVSALALTLLTACNQTTGGLAGLASGEGKGAKSSLALASATETWARRYEKNPKDVVVAINYGRHLRALGNSNKALEVLTEIAEADPKNPDIAAEVGRAALEANDLATAEKAFTVAQTGPAKDWKLYSALGTLKARQGKQKQAQDYYQTALKLNPEANSVRSNLALSYALDGKRDKAEALVKTASASGDARVQQNVAYVLSKSGKAGQAAPATQVASLMPRALPLDEDEDPKVADATPLPSSRPAPRGLFVARAASAQTASLETTSSIDKSAPATARTAVVPATTNSATPKSAAAKSAEQTLPPLPEAKPITADAVREPAFRWPWSKKPAAESLAETTTEEITPARTAAPVDISPVAALATPPGGATDKPKFAVASSAPVPVPMRSEDALSRVSDWNTTVVPTEPH